MGEISILRPRRSLVSIPVVEAVYCESCASVSNSSGGCCGVCGNISVWPLAELVPPAWRPACCRARVGARGACREHEPHMPGAVPAVPAAV